MFDTGRKVSRRLYDPPLRELGGPFILFLAGTGMPGCMHMGQPRTIKSKDSCATQLLLLPWSNNWGMARHTPDTSAALRADPWQIAASGAWLSDWQTTWYVLLQEDLGNGGELLLGKTHVLEKKMLLNFVVHSLSFLRNSNFNPSIHTFATRHNERFRELLKVMIAI